MASKTPECDVIWMGLFLHHLPAAAKQDFFVRAGRILPAGGAVIAHDPMPGEGERKEDFQRRLLQGASWSFLDADEREILYEHFSRGHPEPYPALSRYAAAGGLTAAPLFRDPDQEYAVISFTKSPCP